MALINCLECGSEISDKALSCPNCGCPIQTNNSEKLTQQVKIDYSIAKKKSVFAIIFLLLGCIIVSSYYFINREKINNPGEIKVEGKIINYTENKEIVEKIIGSGIETEIFFSNGYSYNDNFKILYNDKGSIRCIIITDSSVLTYKNISVGDNIKKVKDSYNFEAEMGNGYSVLFNGDKEIDLTTKNQSDNWLWINYSIDDSGKIEEIIIYDAKFGQKML